jgi:hypothetical protein
VFTFKGPNKSKLGLKILLNGFLVEFLDIDVNEKTQLAMISMVLNGKT